MTRPDFTRRRLLASTLAAPAVSAPGRPKSTAVDRILAAKRVADTWTILKVNMGGFIPTWAASGDQFLAIGEGSDLDTPRTKSFWGSVYRLRGNPPDERMETLAGFPAMPLSLLPTEYAEARCGGILAVGNRIYVTIVTPNRPYIEADGRFSSGWRGLAVKVIYSDDDGRTWRNADGSHPVVWDKWDGRTKDNSLFYDEPYLFTTFLQMGRGYSDNQDGYVYVYGVRNGEEMLLSRVPQREVMSRRAYEFLAGFGDASVPRWSKSMGDAATVFTFPRGWKSTRADEGMVPSGWHFSVVHNRPLGAYMMVGQGTGAGADGGWHGKSPYLGLWVSPTPWGPFRQIHEDLAWKPGQRDSARPYNPQIPPKWISPDGRSFWLTWSDYETRSAAEGVNNPDAGVIEYLKKLRPRNHAEFSRGFYDWNIEHQVSLGMNMQRVDLTVS